MSANDENNQKKKEKKETHRKLLHACALIHPQSFAQEGLRLLRGDDVDRLAPEACRG